jgi:hypothetical protein
VSDPEDEPRLVRGIDLRNARINPGAVVTPDGNVHHLGGIPVTSASGYVEYTQADSALLEDRLLEYPDHMAVPFSCAC